MNRFVIPTLILLGLLVACDTTRPTDDSDPHFDMTIGAPVEASVEGTASLGNSSSFEEGTLFRFTFPGVGTRMTAVQLFGQDDEGVPHDLSFLYVDDEGITSGQYEVNAPFGCFEDEGRRCSGGSFDSDRLFTADYGRQTSDSLFTYPGLEGTVTIETARPDLIEGQFDLSATREVAIAQADLRTFMDSLHNQDHRAVPLPLEQRELDSPVTITGQFTATPNEFSGGVSHVNWMISGRVMRF